MDLTLLGPLASLAGSWNAEVGSETFGVLSNPYLAKAARCVRYDLKVEIEGDNHFSYEEDTILELSPVAELFHHTDRNRLQRI